MGFYGLKTYAQHYVPQKTPDNPGKLSSYKITLKRLAEIQSVCQRSDSYLSMFIKQSINQSINQSLNH